MKILYSVVLYFSLSYYSSAQPLKGTNWLLESIEDLSTGKSKMVGTKAKAALYFESDSIYTGVFCNKYRGKYHNPGYRDLRMDAPISTKVYCVGIDKIEKELFTFYPKVAHYRIEKDLLFIFTTNDFRLTFKKH